MTTQWDNDSYEQLFILFSNKVERWILKIVLSLFIFLFLFQSLLQIPDLRSHLSRIEKLEGTPYRFVDFLVEDRIKSVETD